jgi:hypothetical protein
MSKQQQARDGRESIAFILEPSATPVADSSASLAAGEFGFVLAKAASGAYKDIPKGKPILASAAMSGASGDSIVKCTPYFLGFATGKSMSRSKTTQNVTMDYDAMQNNIVSDDVAVSGSISGFSVTESLADQYSAINIIKSRFGDIIENNEGTITVKEAAVTEKDILAIFWNWRDCKVGDLVEVDVVASLFSNLSTDAAYQSGQSFNVDFTGNSGDENDYQSAKLQVKVTADLKSAIDALMTRSATVSR